MEIIDATPPADFPDIVVIMDKNRGRNHPNKAFYLRVKVDGGVEQVDLDGAITPNDARKIALEKGYTPTHWMLAEDAVPTRYY